MTGTWEPKTKYYIILNQGQLKQALGSVIEDKMKYKPKKDGSEYLLEDVFRNPKYLEGNKVAISIQITNAKYADGEMNLMNVDDFITEEDFELAKEQFGVTEFLTEEEYITLTPLEE